MKILSVAGANRKEILVQMINKAMDDNQWSVKKAAHILQTATTDIYRIKMLKTACAVETQRMLRIEQTRCKSYTIDEGRSLKVGLQEQALNYHKLL